MEAVARDLLKNKNVLRLMTVVSIMNLFGYVLVKDLDAVAIFLITGFVTSYFSKNMIVIMLSALLVTNFVIASKNFNRIKEGLDNMKRENDKKSKKAKKDKTVKNDKKTEKNVSKNEKDDEEKKDDEKVGELDHAATVEAAYDQIDKLLSSDSIKNMTNDTQRLAQKQAKLMEQMQSMQPLIENASAMLEKIGGSDKLSGMVQNLTGMMTKFSGPSESK